MRKYLKWIEQFWGENYLKKRDKHFNQLSDNKTALTVEIGKGLKPNYNWISAIKDTHNLKVNFADEFNWTLTK